MEEKVYSVNGVEFTERESRLIENCVAYAFGDPAGVPGHGLMILIGKLTKAYPVLSDIEYAVWDFDWSKS
jgi:hypothetical protein